MRRTLKKILVTTLVVTLLSASISFDSIAATTVGDLIGDEAVDDTQDAVRLINLAILRNVDLTKITYRDKTIIDTLTEDEINDYAFSDSTIRVYSEAMGQARTGLQNGWTPNDVLTYANEAYRVYNDRIAKLATENLTAEDVEAAVLAYIRNNVESNIDIGDIEEQLPLLISDYRLQSIIINTISDKIKIDTNVGVMEIDGTNYECIETGWYTNGQSMKALINGTVSEIAPTSLSTSIGGDEHRLVIKYESEKPIILLDESIEVGTHIMQGTEILSGADTTFTITLTYNDEYNIDLLRLLGPTGKILVNEYKRTQAEPYDANRDKYIEHYLDLINKHN